MLDTSDEYYMKEALKEARKAFDADEIPVGAVIVCNDRIIARSYNNTEQLNAVTAHAEMLAIREASRVLGSWRMEDCTLYVTLEPCIMCAGALGWSQISRVVYGASDPKRGYSTFSPNALHPKTEVVSGILATESLELIQSFFAARRK